MTVETSQTTLRKRQWREPVASETSRKTRRQRRWRQHAAPYSLVLALAFLPPPLGTSASPLAPFLDVTFSDALCGTWATDYAALHARIRETARSHAPTLAQTAAAAANAAAAAATGDPSIRFLTFEWLDEPGGLGDYITGLATAFACALLTRRAFIVRHPYLPLAFAPNLVDWSFGPDVPYEPARKLTVDEVLARVGEKGGGGEGGEGGRGGGGGGGGGEKGELVQEGEVVIVNLRNRFVEPEEFFAVLDGAMNIRVSWNRGLLTYLLAQVRGSGVSPR
ncbi:unnamed protein product [Closterium sp. NIES-65]|nr:unnamed protein product [Closterium sp. NIES-65]